MLGDATSVEARLCGPWASASAPGVRGGPAAFRLLKRSLRHTYLAVGCQIAGPAPEYFSAGSKKGSLEAFEVVRTSPSAPGLQSWAPPPPSASPRSRCPGSEALAVVRVTSRTMVTLVSEHQPEPPCSLTEAPALGGTDAPSAPLQHGPVAGARECHEGRGGHEDEGRGASGRWALERLGAALTAAAADSQGGTGSGSPPAALNALRSLVLLPLWLRAGGASSLRDLSLLPRGLLLSGPPGVGKTFAVQRAVDDANALLAAAAGVAAAAAPGGGGGGPSPGGDDAVLLLVLRGAEVLGLGVGDAEAHLRAVFARAHAHAADKPAAGPSSGAAGRRVGLRAAVIFFDEVDALCPKRDADSTDGAAVR